MAKKSRLGAKPLDWIQNTKQDELPPGVRLSNIEWANPSTLKKNKLNAHFKKEDSEYFENLREDIKKRGILVPLIAKRSGELLSGHNRLFIAIDLDLPSVPVQFAETKLSESEEREFLFKDNILRRQLSAQDKKDLIISLYGAEIDMDNRGGDRKSDAAKIKSSSELLIPLPDKIEKETGIKAGTAKRILASIRKESKETPNQKEIEKSNDAPNNEKSSRSIQKLKKHLSAIRSIFASIRGEENAEALEILNDFTETIKKKHVK